MSPRFGTNAFPLYPWRKTIRRNGLSRGLWRRWGVEEPGLEAVDYVIVVAGPAARGFLGDGCVTVTVSADRRYVEDLVNSLHNS